MRSAGRIADKGNSGATLRKPQLTSSGLGEAGNGLPVAAGSTIRPPRLDAEQVAHEEILPAAAGRRASRPRRGRRRG